MLILAIVLVAVVAGWVANLVLGGGMFPDDWTELLIAGLVGSFVGGLTFSLISGNGLDIHPTGLIGSILGAVIVLAVWRAVRSRAKA